MNDISPQEATPRLRYFIGLDEWIIGVLDCSSSITPIIHQSNELRIFFLAFGERMIGLQRDALGELCEHFPGNLRIHRRTAGLHFCNRGDDFVRLMPFKR